MDLRINMTHGSGGKATSELIGNVFSGRLGNPVLNRLEDAAVLNLAEVLSVGAKMAYTTDSFVVSPIFFKGGDIGRLAICGTVNDLLCMGARPLYLTAGFIIEEGLAVKDLERIADSMAEALSESGTVIAAADTKVIEGKGGIYINTSGIGYIPEGIKVGADRLASGDAVILSGTLGDHHACILSHRLEIENDISSDAAPLNGVVEALFKEKIRVKALRDVTRGGLATILNELADASACAIHLDYKAIPVADSVSALCGILGLDPLYMGNEGKMVIAVNPEDAQRALELIRNAKYGENAAIIGTIQKGKGVVISTDTGSSRILNMLYGEGLPRIC